MEHIITNIHNVAFHSLISRVKSSIMNISINFTKRLNIWLSTKKAKLDSIPTIIQSNNQSESLVTELIGNGVVSLSSVSVEKDVVKLCGTVESIFLPSDIAKQATSNKQRVYLSRDKQTLFHYTSNPKRKLSLDIYSGSGSSLDIQSVFDEFVEIALKTPEGCSTITYTTDK